MSFDENNYLKWYIPKLSPFSDAINLHSSGMPAVSAESLNSPHPTDFEMLPRVEGALAKNLGISRDEVLFTPGATGGTLLALLALAGRRSDIVVETPVYEPMMQQAARLGNVKKLPRTFETGWQIDIARATEMIDEQTAMVLITEPGNPGGVFSSHKSVAKLADICKKKGAYLLINEVYLGYSKRESFHGLADNVLIVNSYSKLLGSYSNRVGWLSGKAALIERLRWAGINMGISSVPSAAVGLAFAKEAKERTAMARAASAKWVDTVNEWVDACPKIDWIRPEGPGFGAIKLPTGIDDLAFINQLYDEKRVLAVPGSLFFAPGTIRISWLNVGDRLSEGLDIISEMLKNRPD